MPWMFYRYIMGEVVRVFLLSATVLVLVVAFAAAIKPLAADDLAGPLRVAKYVMLAIVPMLQFSIPVAAGFAATLVMHRYAACHVAGDHLLQRSRRCPNSVGQ